MVVNTGKGQRNKYTFICYFNDFLQVGNKCIFPCGQQERERKKERREGNARRTWKYWLKSEAQNALVQ